MSKEDRIALVVGLAAALGWLGWQYLTTGYSSQARGGRPSSGPVGSGIYGAALDVTGGQVTPDRLLSFGPLDRPPTWQPHRVRYPLTPGTELERLIYGAPGSYNETTSVADRGWLFSPPSEADF